ncbi:hypothetical protein JCM10207_000070 [Rhodosporidiobolus poonsookiae]
MPHFTLHSVAKGANGWTVDFVLKALNLDYTTKWYDLSPEVNEQKSPEYLKLNPNGRLPALVDHENGDFVIWETKAILLYLVEKYDTQRTLTVGRGVEEQAELLQWLFFQASGQGPYFGQVSHFLWAAPEKIPYGLERYQNEILRVYGVLERVLQQREEGKRWLVGGKCTIADLSFITWNKFAPEFLLPPNVDFAEQFPTVAAWQAEMIALPYVEATYRVIGEEFAKLAAAEGK